MRRFEDVAVPIEAPLSNPSARPVKKSPARPKRPSRPKWLKCPVCLMGWSTSIRREGGRCDDHSQGQVTNCVGRLIPSHEFDQAEWRDMRLPETHVTSRAYGPKRMGVYFAAVTINPDGKRVATHLVE